jgi:hypothetical protein
MKKFKFTLQTVHNVRELRQEKEEFVLSQLQAEAQKTVDRLAELEKMHLGAIEQYGAKMQTGAAINISVLELERNHISALDAPDPGNAADFGTAKTCVSAANAKTRGGDAGSENYRSSARNPAIATQPGTVQTGTNLAR